MRNYVVINNKDSREIKGLLISSLAPISKPLQRNNIEEIDGRDGDVITKLGYSAYDKEVTIGLYGSYNVDEIIKYFDSGGIVTFSNEPDKYYKSSILEQIDFEKLVRFKTATVVFHVQPFKYSTLDNKKEYSSPTSPIYIRNNGNYFSKPIMTIQGSGTINLSLNDVQLFVIDLQDGEITIDFAEMNAYLNTVYKNRRVQGNYDNFNLNVGNNKISWTGTVSYISIENYSRWI